jgi:hypothetical protein
MRERERGGGGDLPGPAAAGSSGSEATTTRSGAAATASAMVAHRGRWWGADADVRRWWDAGIGRRSSPGADPSRRHGLLEGRKRERESRGRGQVSLGLRAVCGRYPHRLCVVLLVFSIKLSSLKSFEE